MDRLNKAFLLLLVLTTSIFAQPIDLEEEFFSTCVVNTKQIIVPGFPYAFNPSLIRWEGSLLLSFRAGKEYSYTKDIPPHSEDFFEYDYVNQYSPNRIVLVWLDEDLNPRAPPQILNIPNYNTTYRQQDPRLVVVGDRMYIVYSEIVRGVFIEYTRRMCVAEVFIENGYFYVRDTVCLTAFDGVKEPLWEKNWVPFDYEDNLLLAYSLNPHKILHPLLTSGICSTVASTSKKTGWNWGVLRGGTPAILIDNHEYLGFFHSSTILESVESGGKPMQHYFMGAYTFSSQPPFDLKRISPHPIVGDKFYKGPKHKTWKPLIVVFPGGIVEEQDHFLVAYGRQDHEMWITKIDKQSLLEGLVDIN